jgi:hypothetical protein
MQPGDPGAFPALNECSRLGERLTRARAGMAHGMLACVAPPACMLLSVWAVGRPSSAEARAAVTHTDTPAVAGLLCLLLRSATAGGGGRADAAG